ncbi:LysR family nitrogen assimilation transcriptional regulator [Variovorax paradoxus]|uniref:LysR substrate-binding domain-containing protein n=1 Tax=Variovorax paradoxus TaxID=34073 RepID=UPI00278F96EA|nr:LysR substrate-binding domain-containing protein [Variovorax paradoxus]MDQ0570632.1 LysR family nitrogen assimilation transcriptional regulator [Variovorax paradoxus]
MDLKQLEYFVHVAELGSFTRASIVIDVAQPALSRQVRQLEVELRQNLLTRNGRGVTLTDAGKLLLDHARGILHQIERAKEDLGLLRGALAGRVAVGLPPSIAKRIAVPLTRAFRQQLPDASLSITEALSSALQESVTAGRIDLALLYNPAPSADIDSVVILEEDLYLVGPAQPGGKTGEAVSLRDVASAPLVIPTKPNSIRMLVEAEMANIGCRPSISMEIDGVAAILDLVIEGMGLAVLSSNAILTAPRPEAFAIRRIESPPLRSRLALALSSQRPTTLTQQAVLTLIREVVTQTMSNPPSPARPGTT